MNLQQGLWQQQTLKLAMTQELTQAIALLQYNVQELSQFLENKALENPLLQVESREVQAMDPRLDRVKSSQKQSDKDKQYWIEQMAKNEASLEEALISQLHVKDLTAERKRLLQYIIGSLDENGYFRSDIKEVSQYLSLPEEQVEHALVAIQALEPAGIGARNLQECLLLQLQRESQNNEVAISILKDFFTEFAEKKWKVIAQKLGIKLSDIQDVYDSIQGLNPRPAASFQVEGSSYITPEVIIRWDGTAFQVSVFDEALPKISFNQGYYQEFSAYKDQQVKKFLQDNHQDYQWIMRSIEQRKETIKRVALKIVEKQPDFFIKGPQFLRPMTMKEIADELEIHESTVSRTVREKYAQTPFGTFELRSFFSSTIKTTSMEDASAKTVQDMIQRFIQSEDKKKPLSDQIIANALKEEEGMVISRRTIAKYREQLGIPASSKRKRYE